MGVTKASTKSQWLALAPAVSDSLCRYAGACRQSKPHTKTHYITALDAIQNKLEIPHSLRQQACLAKSR